MQPSAKITLIAALMLAIFAGVIWNAQSQADRGGILTVSFLDIGQGDSIFIQSPTGSQVLIDGGPDTTVLRRLGEVMPWYDRSIDLLIGTHADSDHIGGLVDVLPRYRIGTVLVPDTEGDTDTWRSYLRGIGADEQNGTKVIEALRGERIDLGGGAYLDILSPDRPLPSGDTNTGCIVSRLVYGTTSFMLTCDAPAEVEKYLVEEYGTALRSTVLKAGHHGSNTASSPLFVGMVDPKYTVFSRGCNNKYGHPAPQTVATMARFGIPADDTCKEGTVTFVSDGTTVVKR